MTVAHCHSPGTHGTEFSLSRAASRGRCSWCGQGHHCVQSPRAQTHGHRDTHTHTYTHTHHTTPHHTTPQHTTHYTTHYTTQHNTTQTNPFTTPSLLSTLFTHIHICTSSSPRFLPLLFPFVRPHTYSWSFDVVLCIYPRFSFTKPWRLWQQCMNLEHGGLSCARPFESAMQQRTSGGRLFGMACRRSQDITTH